MRTSSKKTYHLAGVFMFILMLAIALLISFAGERICQKQTQLIVFETTDTNGTATAISQPEEDAVLSAEPVPSESVYLEETTNAQENNTLFLEMTQLETECPVVTEVPVETQVTTASEEKHSFAEMDLLFIGDSRTVGLADYATIENAHFFSAIGMSVYNVGARSVAVPKIGKITLDELLNHKQYDIIYIMLGINELGYAFEKTVAQYEQLVESVKQLQPDAIVILMANLHVTSERSKTDKYINNPAIDRFNNATARLADTKTVFYLDANSLFDDKDGNLDKGKSADNAHLKAKCYVQWADWLKNETSEIILRIEGEKSD